MCKQMSAVHLIDVVVKNDGFRSLFLHREVHFKLIKVNRNGAEWLQCKHRSNKKCFDLALFTEHAHLINSDNSTSLQLKRKRLL